MKIHIYDLEFYPQKKEGNIGLTNEICFWNK